MLGEGRENSTYLTDSEISFVKTTFENRKYKGKLRLPSEKTVFVKSDPNAPDRFFEAEYRSLNLIKELSPQLAPNIFYYCDFLIILNYYEPSPPSKEKAINFGRQLAYLHSIEGDFFGATWPGFIGPLKVPNSKRESWISYQIENRIEPLISYLKKGPLMTKPLYSKLKYLEEAISKINYPYRPRFVHGDLWAGNILWLNNRCILIDPSAHFGDPYADLAMMKLFAPPFISEILFSYFKYSTIENNNFLIELNKIYYLLVHAILFGESYLEPLNSVLNLIIKR